MKLGTIEGGGTKFVVGVGATMSTRIYDLNNRIEVKSNSISIEFYELDSFKFE